jgi:glycosyltransferase involved in cell wall biosynthesis
MKILHVSHNYFPVVGGAEVMIQHLSEGLAQRGHVVTVLTSNAPSTEAYVNAAIKPLPAGEETINGVLVQRLPIFQLSTPLRKSFSALMLATWRTRFPGNDLLRILWTGPYIPSLRREMLLTPADLLAVLPFPFLHVYQAARVARRRCLPFVVVPCTHPLDAWAFDNPRHYQVLRQAQAVIANTSYEKDFLVAKGVPDEQVHVVGEGVDQQQFNRAVPGNFRTRHGIGLQEPMVLFVGRKAEGKGLEPLLGAMRQVWETEPAAWLVLAGSSSDFFRQHIEPEIARLPEEMRRRLVNLNDFPEAEKDALYTDCDVLVLPSRVESFGIVFLEAWACGKAVIGCRTGPVASVVSDGVDGLLVPYGEETALAGAILYLLGDADLRHRLGQAGGEKVLRQYTWPQIVSRVEEVYRLLVGTHTPPARV